MPYSTLGTKYIMTGEVVVCQGFDVLSVFLASLRFSRFRKPHVGKELLPRIVAPCRMIHDCENHKISISGFGNPEVSGRSKSRDDWGGQKRNEIR
jgi:hypothetical protein